MQACSDHPSKGGHVCPGQLAFFLDNWIRRRFQNPVKIIGEYIAAGDTVVDVGCGPGFFTIDMARIVGPAGKVMAVDMQPGMLARVKKKALRKGLADRIVAHPCRADRMGLQCDADFILAFYMVHETPDPGRFFEEAKSMLKPDGKLLVVEPKIHVRKATFDVMLKQADQSGLAAVDYPKGKGGRAVLLIHQ